MSGFESYKDTQINTKLFIIKFVIYVIIWNIYINLTAMN